MKPLGAFLFVFCGSVVLLGIHQNPRMTKEELNCWMIFHVLAAVGAALFFL